MRTLSSAKRGRKTRRQYQRAVQGLPHQHLQEYTVKCEFCGEKAKPSLDLSREQQAALNFCCAKRQQLHGMLEKQRCLVGQRSSLKLSISTSLGDEPDTEEIPFQVREMDDPNKFLMGLQCGLEEQAELTVFEDDSTQTPVAETSAPEFKVLSFRLSCNKENGRWTVYSSTEAEEHPKIEEEEQVLIPQCNHKPLKFGLCYHQGGSDVLQRIYSSGEKFLTAFPDGSAQVFYPSGLLALIVIVTRDNGRVCIVYDDIDVPCQPVRAMFQSDGRATCYQSNGNIWLSLNRSGGQCLDENGSKVRHWSWNGRSLTPTQLHPIFLSLNKNVGVRVLGREQAFVSFLAKGQQAKFSVGNCSAQNGCQTDNQQSVLKEEQFVLAARMRILLVVKNIHQYLATPSHRTCRRTDKVLTSTSLPRGFW
ncbi:glutamate-rich protein 6 [Antennarius striatus]|uniref:glutamate-rich protein 6 n=1 Tax=Antennarius striatus TaxID=241820 RepID=UPI0035B16D2B